MGSHKAIVHDYKSNLKIWHDYSKTLNFEKLEKAGRYLIGAMSNAISEDNLKKCIQTVDELVKEGRKRSERRKNDS